MTGRRPLWKTVLGIVLTAIMLFPLYWMINVAFTEQRNLRARPPHWFPFEPTLDGFRAVFDTQLPSMATSLGVALGTVVLTIVIAAPAGYALGILRVKGRSQVNFLLLVTQMIPGIVMAMGFYAIFIQLGVLNTLPGLVVANSTMAVPFAVMLYTAFMSGMPREMLEAARIDGATRWRVFVSVVFPLSKNATLTVSLFAFLWAWSDFIFASTLNRAGQFQPITISIYQFMSQNLAQWNAIMATAVVASIPAAILLVVAQRYVAAGLTAGAVKD